MNLRAVMTLSLILSASSCGLDRAISGVGKIADTVAENRETIQDIVGTVSRVVGSVGEINDKVAAALRQADRDGDGQLSPTEIALAGGIAGKSLWDFFRNKGSDKRKTDTEMRVLRQDAEITRMKEELAAFKAAKLA